MSEALPAGAGGAMLSRFHYRGQAILPELQLYHHKARVHDPVIGRFLQTDPVGYDDDLNLYAYVRNDPLNMSDPTGEQGRDPDDPYDPTYERRTEIARQPQPTNTEGTTYTLTAEGVAAASLGSLALTPPRAVGTGGGGAVEGGLYYHDAPAGEPDSFGLIGEASVRVGNEVGATVNLGASPGGPDDGADFVASASRGLVSVTGDVTGEGVSFEGADIAVRRVGLGRRVGASTGPVVGRGHIPLWTEPPDDD